MIKKILKISIVFLALFYLNVDLINAYEFINPSNEQNVMNKVREVFDTRDQYVDLAGEYEEETIDIHSASSKSYWWPIGSQETVEYDGKTFATGLPETVSISSNFGYRNLNGKNEHHSGIDINKSTGLNSVNIIAAKDGIVVYPKEVNTNNCPSGSNKSCGGSYGNYIIIKHNDGNYTLYAHLYEGSIKVKSGDAVKQGQVIAKMGSSGNSTGPHLHFEVREGSNAYKFAADPLYYINPEKPREIISGDELVKWINSWEGHSPIEGDNYIVEDIGDGVRTVGCGVTLEYDGDRFLSRGIDVTNYTVGSKLPISVVDEIELENFSEKRDYIENVLVNNNIVLEEYQIQALISQMYNIGDINGFVEAYKTYGNTQALYDNWFFRAIMKGSKFEKGLTERRNAEWALFNSGVYVYNS